MSFNLSFVPEPGAWPISAIADLQTTLNSKLSANDGLALNGAPPLSGTFVGSGTPAHLWQNVTSTAGHGSLPEVGAQYTLSATNGLAHKESAYKIALTASVVANPNSADIYSINTITHGYAGTGGHLITGIESDVNNVGADAPTIGAGTSSYGFVAVGAGNYRSTAAYWATAVNPSRWQYGFAASNTSGSAVYLSTFYDETQSTNVLHSTTQHQIGVNFFSATFTSGHAYIAPNNTCYSASNAAGTATQSLIKLNPSDEVVVGNGAVSIKANSPYFLPGYDNTAVCGYSTFRWQTIYAANGTIQTSDLRDKTDRKSIDGALALSILRDVAADKDGLITYRWIVGGNELVEVDGETVTKPIPGKRFHAGWGAQVWEKTLSKYGMDIGLVVKEDKDNPDSKLSLRPDQAIPLVHAGLIEVDKRLQTALLTIERLTKRVSQLEAKLVKSA